MSDKATLTLDGEQYDLPLVIGSEDEPSIDISSLRARTGYITLDTGYANTGSCQSSITYIDGEKGILRYRGIPIEQFANGPNFIEVVWLLDLRPSADHRRNTLTLPEILPCHANLDEGMKSHFDSFPRTAPPMAVLSSMINTLSCFHPELLELEDTEQFRMAAARLISKIRTIAAYAYRHSTGQPYIYPDPHQRYVHNFLHMMFSQPYDQYVCDDLVRDALNLILILHADHEQNCSTSTVRMVASSGCQPVHLLLCRRRRTLGPTARRCQRGGHEHAGGDPQRQHDPGGVCKSRQG